MSKCVICDNYFHSDYCTIKEIRGESVTVCLFCHFDKNKLTLEDKDGKIVRKITKSKCIKEYKEYINKLYRSKRIQDIINKVNE